MRVANGRVDIGAYEAQPNAPSSADFDGDDDVDGHNFLRWQHGLGREAPFAVKSDGDADNDRDVDADDLAVWKPQFGNPPPAESALAASALPSFSDLGSAVAETRIPVAEKPHNSADDDVFAAGDFTQLFATSGADDHDAPRRSYRPRRRR